MTPQTPPSKPAPPARVPTRARLAQADPSVGPPSPLQPRHPPRLLRHAWPSPGFARSRHLGLRPDASPRQGCRRDSSSRHHDFDETGRHLRVSSFHSLTPAAPTPRARPESCLRLPRPVSDLLSSPKGICCSPLLCDCSCLCLYQRQHSALRWPLCKSSRRSSESSTTSN